MYNLYLDDLRIPTDTYPSMDASEWIVVKSYDEFVKYIEANGLPAFISFDHDLADEHYRKSMYDKVGKYNSYYTDGTFKEKTGFECAKWLVEYCMNNNATLPACGIHSANPVGAENIRSYLQSFLQSRTLKESQS